MLEQARLVAVTQGLRRGMVQGPPDRSPPLRASSRPCALIRCCNRFGFRLVETVSRAQASDHVTECRRGLFRRKGQHVGASRGRDAERERRCHVVVEGIEHVGAGQLIAVI